ncbi:MerR family regulatory protein [Quadrisphaera granulorum]|uniref:MerR-like DNA binding protein n=1 Tax=Quadrisphaera granulorum TaxID=317664 RepID=A0A316ACJ9_9ACTN|nr:MerR family transcriptional regulator [Quadrisphaera granulorum]PWJ54700.1 MerR-like DNA binding protein [Quadrisphaera granulorum]SZE96062.1 MerR family regulatory protein [Quadrisphaera granulorum]
MTERAPSPARRPAQAVPAAAGPLLTIGELLGRLSPEFPDVTHSKVRFLEDRGLVTPQRTPSGYRKFTLADLERLRTVLRLQRDQYLPLRVIREHLDALDADPNALPPEGSVRSSARPRASALEPAVVAGAAAEADAVALADDQDDDDGDGLRSATSGAAPGAGGEQAAPARGPVPRSEVLLAAGGSLALLESLEDHGLLPRERAGLYPHAALALVRAAVVLGEHGIEPRHLRALRTAVGAEAALVEQVVNPLRRVRPGDRHAERQGERASELPGGVSARSDEAERVGGQLVSSLLALHAAALGCALDGVPPAP